jgi:hypothetical protein
VNKDSKRMSQLSESKWQHTFGRCNELLNLTTGLEQIRRNTVQTVNMNNFSSNIFSSTLIFEKMCTNDHIRFSLWLNEVK